MTSKELREKFLSFFEKKGHNIVPSSSLLPTDPSVLFTTAGMQQFKPYYLGEKSPLGKNAASSQKCFRTSDIEAVGDESHLTFLEMLGNFSFGGYFKEEAIQLAFDLVNSKFQIPKSKIAVTVFEGDNEVPRDEESVKIWKKLGILEEKIFGFGKKDNFWGPTGKEGPCGPTTEIHIQLRENPCKKGKDCIPNCACGRFIELWNLVFNEYFQDEKGKLTPLKQKGVDTGMGLERLAMICQVKNSVYETDLFEPIIQKIQNSKFSEGETLFPYGAGKIQNSSERSERIIADHIKSAVFLISEGIFPSNVERGYVLRRILRRAIRYGKFLNLPKNFLIPLAQKIIEIYKDVYPEVKSKETDVLTVIQNEEEKFEKTLDQGLKEFNDFVLRKEPKRGRIGVAWDQSILYGKEAFYLYQSFGFPKEIMQEICKEKDIEFDEKGFNEEFEKHQKISRAGVEKKFGGVGKEASYEAAKLHTATHLLHAALRKILGAQVKQMGSDITPQRLRFDFSHSKKMTAEEIKKVEDLVNQKIKEDLEVKKEEMSYEEAIKSGALAFFKEKYPERVSVYSCGDFSKEICAGPHIKKTSELGHFKIKKEESSGAGIRRIRGGFALKREILYNKRK